MIYLLTGPVQSGKTTALAEWAERREAAGVLQPVRDGKRYVRALPSGASRLLECSDEEAEAAVRVGRFRFSASAFVWGRRKLRDALDAEPEWIVVDEIGPLELRGEGLALTAGDVLRSRTAHPEAHAIAVVRERLLSVVRARYDLRAARTVRPAELRTGEWFDQHSSLPDE